MSTRLVILGLLRDRPLHGYEIKHIIEDHMGDWTSIAFGSIYFALGKLAEEGFIEKAGTEQEGGRPSRSIFRITGHGQREFERLLRDVWANLEREYFSLDIGLFFMNALPREETVAYLRERVARLDGIIEHASIHKAEQLSQPEVPALAATIFDHSLAHYRAELDWTKGVLQAVQSGEWE